MYFARDAEIGDDVAVKVLPHDPFGGAQSESTLLTVVRKADRRGKCPIVRFDGLFRHKGLDCLVFERLGADMYEVLRATRHTGISLADTRRVARCILRAFVLLLQEEIVHCDVKPENILVSRGLGSYVMFYFGFGCGRSRWVLFVFSVSCMSLPLSLCLSLSLSVSLCLSLWLSLSLCPRLFVVCGAASPPRRPRGCFSWLVPQVRLH